MPPGFELASLDGGDNGRTGQGLRRRESRLWIQDTNVPGAGPGPVESMVWAACSSVPDDRVRGQRRGLRPAAGWWKTRGPAQRGSVSPTGYRSGRTPHDVSSRPAESEPTVAAVTRPPHSSRVFFPGQRANVRVRRSVSGGTMVQTERFKSLSSSAAAATTPEPLSRSRRSRRSASSRGVRSRTVTSLATRALP